MPFLECRERPQACDTPLQARPSPAALQRGQSEPVGVWVGVRERWEGGDKLVMGLEIRGPKSMSFPYLGKG